MFWAFEFIWLVPVLPLLAFILCVVLGFAIKTRHDGEEEGEGADHDGAKKDQKDKDSGDVPSEDSISEEDHSDDHGSGDHGHHSLMGKTQVIRIVVPTFILIAFIISLFNFMFVIGMGDVVGADGSLDDFATEVEAGHEDFDGRCSVQGAFGTYCERSSTWIEVGYTGPRSNLSGMADLGEHINATHDEGNTTLPADDSSGNDTHDDDHDTMDNVTWEQTDLDKGFRLEMGIYIDPLSSFLLVMVTGLCTLIAWYSFGYMSHEPEWKLARYYAELSLFVTGMLGMVISNNFLQLLVFWELMGLCSYLLIGFWHEQRKNASAAKRAFLTTRVGDVFFLGGVVVTFITFNTLSFSTISETLLYWNQNGMIGEHAGTFALISLLMFGGTMGKSGQFPLHVWLPDAMAGPTTVSALIHAATMVKAGIFLLARIYPILIYAEAYAPIFIACIGGFTAIYTASMAMVNVDIKKVLAYSTLSQLSYMVLGLGVGAYLVNQGILHGDHHLIEEGSHSFSAALMHLYNHAFFKALLFLGAGAVIHAVDQRDKHPDRDPNDLRYMGGLGGPMRKTSIFMLLACLAIAGIFPFSGFWSKDGILEFTYVAGSHDPIFYALWILGMATALMTAFYMFRLWFMTFSGKPRSDGAREAHEAVPSMWMPLGILSGMAVLSGLMGVAGSWSTYVRLNIPTIFGGGDHGATAAGHGADAAGHGADAAGHGGSFWEISAQDYLAFLSPDHLTVMLLTILSLALAGIGIFLAWRFFGPKVHYSVVERTGHPAADPAADIVENSEAVRAWHIRAMNRYGYSDFVDNLSYKGVYAGIAKNAWRFDDAEIDGFVNGTRNGAWGLSRLSRWFDERVVDGAVNGFNRLAFGSGGLFRKVHTGRTFDYANIILLGVVALAIVLWVTPYLMGGA